MSTITFQSSIEVANIQINVRGRIVGGRWAGQYLKVEDDTVQSGGYLLIVEPDTNGKNGGDIWIGGSDLVKAFEEAGWEVEWLATS